MSECELQTAYSYSYKKTFNYKKSETTRYNAFIDSQFNHAPVTWMFCQKTHPKIEKIHDKTLKIILQSNASYRSLLECNGSTSIHQRHLHFFINGNLQKCCNHWPPDSCGTYSEKRSAIAQPFVSSIVVVPWSRTLRPLLKAPEQTGRGS